MPESRLQNPLDALAATTAEAGAPGSATGAAVAPAVRISPPPAAETLGSSRVTTSTYSGWSVGYIEAKVETLRFL